MNIKPCSDCNSLNIRTFQSAYHSYVTENGTQMVWFAKCLNCGYHGPLCYADDRENSPAHAIKIWNEVNTEGYFY